jgi:ATP-binding cassette, subfamily B, multidrug efflux pump
VRLTTDVNQVRVMTTSSVTTLLRASLMIVGAILVLLWVDVRLALVMVVFLPVTIAVLAFYQLKGAPLYRKVLANFDGLNQVLKENMAGVRVVQAFVRTDYENARFDKAETPSSGWRRPRRRARRRSSTPRCSS